MLLEGKMLLFKYLQSMATFDDNVVGFLHVEDYGRARSRYHVSGVLERLKVISASVKGRLKSQCKLRG